MKVKEFRTIDEQISLLLSRGLIINDYKTARQALECINYYRLSGYTLTLRKNNIFYPGVRFEDVLELYNFDSCLRRLILDFSETIEIEMRTHIAYHHAEKYGELGYLDLKNYINPEYAIRFLKKLFDEINTSKEVFIEHHRQKYNGNFPIWVAIETISFGELSHFYANLLPKDKTLIAKKYYGTNRFYVENWFRCASELRNVCAHRGRIYNRPLSSGVNLFAEYKSLNKHAFFAYFIALLKLMNVSKKNEFSTAFKTIKSKHPYVKMTHLGAPNNWESILDNICTSDK